MSFRLIAFTPEKIVPGEAEIISLLLDGGFSYVHLRHPRSTAEDARKILNGVPAEYHPFIRLHDHFELLSEFNLAGVQLSRRNPTAPKIAASVTRSCHSLSELDNINGYKYVTLSPVYPSISKSGYTPRENFLQAKNVIIEKPVIALGGVRVENIPELTEAGFSGVAMLGEIWETKRDRDDMKNFLRKIKQII